MHTVGAFEAKTHFSALLEQVEHGEQILITKHGHPVARLVPVKEEVDQERQVNAVKNLQEFAQTHNLKLGDLDWKVLRDEGRR